MNHESFKDLDDIGKLPEIRTSRNFYSATEPDEEEEKSEDEGHIPVIKSRIENLFQSFEDPQTIKIMDFQIPTISSNLKKFDSPRRTNSKSPKSSYSLSPRKAVSTTQRKFYSPKRQAHIVQSNFLKRQIELGKPTELDNILKEGFVH